MKEFSKSNLLSRAIEIRPKNELVGHLSELSLRPIAQTNKLKNTTAAQTFGARPSRDLLVHVARVSCIAYCS